MSLTYGIKSDAVWPSLYLSSSVLSDWLSGNVLVSINVVDLRWTRLVPGWVTILRRGYHLRAEPGIQVNSARAIPP